jgi:hypothetical protein
MAMHFLLLLITWPVKLKLRGGAPQFLPTTIHISNDRDIRKAAFKNKGLRRILEQFPPAPKRSVRIFDTVPEKIS